MYRDYKGSLNCFKPRHENCFTYKNYSNTTFVFTVEDTCENCNYFGCSIVV